jgi:hypothetical protein
MFQIFAARLFESRVLAAFKKQRSDQIAAALVEEEEAIRAKEEALKEKKANKKKKTADQKKCVWCVIVEGLY